MPRSGIAYVLMQRMWYADEDWPAALGGAVGLSPPADTEGGWRPRSRAAAHRVDGAANAEMPLVPMLRFHLGLKGNDAADSGPSSETEVCGSIRRIGTRQ